MRSSAASHSASTAAHVGPFREVGRFARIACEIEQLRPVADVVDVFPAAVADHEACR